MGMYPTTRLLDYLLHTISHSVMLTNLTSLTGLTRRTYKYRLRPTSRQARLLQHNLDLCRELYNTALQHRRDAYRMAGKSVNFAEQSAALSKIGTLKVKLHRPVRGKVKTVQVKREGNRWFVCFSVETEVKESGLQAHAGPAVGI